MWMSSEQASYAVLVTLKWLECLYHSQVTIQKLLCAYMLHGQCAHIMLASAFGMQAR